MRNIRVDRDPDSGIGRVTDEPTSPSEPIEFDEGLKGHASGSP